MRQETSEKRSFAPAVPGSAMVAPILAAVRGA